MSAYLDDLKEAFAAGFPVYYYRFLLKNPSWSGWESGYYMEADDRSAWESYKKQREQKETCMCSGHKHAALMAEYAKDAAKTDEPWLLWDYQYDGKWYPLVENPMWQNNREYRRRPEQSDLEKYGVEVGDIWGVADSIGAYFICSKNEQVVGACALSKSIRVDVKHSSLTELLFRRGEVNKL